MFSALAHTPSYLSIYAEGKSVTCPWIFMIPSDKDILLSIKRRKSSMPKSFEQLKKSLGGEPESISFAIDTIVGLSLQAAQHQDEDFHDPHLFQSAKILYDCLRQHQDRLNKSKN